MKNQQYNKLASGAKSTLLTLILVTFLSIGKSNAQAPGIVGVDHVGINVPDIDEAVKYFHDMFGFTPVTQLGPFSMPAEWKKTFHIHENADQVELKMLRAGDGSNIELFAYKPNSGSKEQPYRDDISATHFALYTSDLKATKAYLESKGVKFLSDIQSGGGDTEGETWVYFETPWGATIELNSYPHGKGYEKHNPAVKLWTASSNIELSPATYSKTALKRIADLQIQIWDNTDKQSRSAQLKELYTDDIVLFDEAAEIKGLKDLNTRITQLQHQNPGFKFSMIRIDNSANVVRYYWNYGPKSNPKLISGMDLMIMENGKARSLNVFLDKLPAAKK
ncbi:MULTISPECIES: VOC family protein [Mucilaginibacter]|nr:MULTISPECIES: VOC family protein [Mucilaginibacter]QTE41963.1 VOC family protein [Mucilaginibacter rubeus]QTE48565.1 VOC family protein [Mucilaginibacter rubeus]QTE59951.1 VOC family protein [Mucilaginibacter rubeus]QTE60583.1 VOC family protein [Mucilaginibacter rubeus]QTF59347.1 VOC family protein [Mucilaginibacter rubeus]